jgi:hypothetical protein
MGLILCVGFLPLPCFETEEEEEEEEEEEALIACRTLLLLRAE